jgi:RHS repeat-associated protein
MFQTWGDTTYPIEYVFDAYGQKTEMHTFRGGSGWQGSTWPVATLGTMDITRWIYQEATGLLTAKQDASTKQVLFTYDTLGRIATRRWARLSGGNPIVTTYSYDPHSGDVSGVSHSDGTQGIVFTYDRGGRQATITDDAGAHTLTHNSAGQLESDQISGGLLDGTTVTVGYDALLRRSSLQITRNAATLSSQNYGYDASSRVETVSSGSQTATYAYYPTTGLLNTTTFTGGTQISRSYDSLGRLSSIGTSSPTLGTVASYVYTYNNLDQRTRVTREDNSYWSYDYNDRGELIGGKKYWSDNGAIAGQHTEYVYDSIGNRISTKAGGDPQGLNLRQAIYTANSLNQYQQRSVPAALDISGTANAAATVTVNDQATYRRGDYFYKELSVDNTEGPAYPQVKAVGVRTGVGGAGEDAVTQIDGHIYLPKNAEVYTYDADGNLTSDGRWVYTWDAENRLASMQVITAAPVTAKLRLEFAYDYIGRRIQKKVYTWNVGAGSYQLQSTTKFVHDGWSLIAELDGNGALIRSNVWGPRGLQLISGSGNAYIVGSDGNQNVSSLINSSTGGIAALYDYDPFGNIMKSNGEYASQNPLKFSSQYSDSETGLVYYGYRYYNPQTGRWINRDPSGEVGGLNNYAFVTNDGVNETDVLGLWKANGTWSGGWHSYDASVTAESCDTLSHLAALITGYESDWRKLGPSDRVMKGEKVNVAPLLVLLEDRLRNRTLSAAKAYNTTWGDFTSSTKPTASLVNKYFAGGFGHSDCAQGLELVYAKALVDVFGADQFDKLGLALIEQIPQLLIDKPGGGSPGEMWIGDSAFIKNYPDYLSLSRRASGRAGASQGENILKVGQSRFWGYTGHTFRQDVKTVDQWRSMLRADYNAVGGQSAPSDQYPQFTGRISFIDTASIAQGVFNDRNK